MHVLMTENQVGGEELYILRKKFPLPTTIYVFVTGNSKFQVVYYDALYWDLRP